ncbi:hypothetical protein CDD81_1185 [Ophiocordyceps australis]|uniref:Casein kinase substrate phosphoprotein PP28 domain-containing protein n=1 Tax=Ophiocordyceps australis TaxID=1399860 RepID=A0A2C5YDP8_9HYPO|nr:hypothetical protein CDD81_1185 [Ophiocordyceps australis]
MGSSKKKTAKHEVVDSWEDDDASSPDEADQGRASDTKTKSLSPSLPEATLADADFNMERAFTDATPSLPRDESKRPEKTDAVARRMIAAGLGIKAPKQTEEQKAYQKAVREQEKKRRDRERAEEQKRRQETERAKAAMWND